MIRLSKALFLRSFILPIAVSLLGLPQGGLAYSQDLRTTSTIIPTPQSKQSKRPKAKTKTEAKAKAKAKAKQKVKPKQVSAYTFQQEFPFRPIVTPLPELASGPTAIPLPPLDLPPKSIELPSASLLKESSR